MPIPVGVAIGGMIAGQLASAYSQHKANQANKANADSTNATNLQIAQNQQDFQERMSNSAYQRTMADMQAAGLNPMLAYQQGGASTPQGASIAAQQPSEMKAVNFGEALKTGVSSAMEAESFNKDLETKDSGIALNTAATATQATQQELNIASAKEAAVRAETATAELPSRKARAAAEEATAKIDQKMTTFDAINNRARTALGTMSSARDLLTPRVKLDFDSIKHKPRDMQKGGDTYEKAKWLKSRTPNSWDHPRGSPRGIPFP